MNISGKYVAVLVDNYFEQAEFEEPIGVLKEAGAEVTIIGTTKLEIRGMNHVKLADSFKVDLLIGQVSSDNYDAVILPGGAINADSLRVNEDAQHFVIEFLEANKPVAAICHAPWLLVSIDMVEGKRLTSYHTIKDDIVNAGGHWVNREVVVDENLITSRDPDDLPAFNRAIITMLYDQESGELQVGSDTPVGQSESRIEQDSRLRSMGYDKKQDQIDDEDEIAILTDDDEADPDELRISTIESDERAHSNHE
jgi:protease I